MADEKKRMGGFSSLFVVVDGKKVPLVDVAKQVSEKDKPEPESKAK